MRPHGAANNGRNAAGQGVFTLLRTQKMGVRLHSPWGNDQPIAMHDGCTRTADQLGPDPVLDGGISGFAHTDDLAVLNADIALHNAQHRVDDRGVLDHHIQPARGRGRGGVKAHPVAHHLAGSGQTLVAIDRMVVLNLGQQRSVAQTHHIARCWSIRGRIGRPCQSGHDPLLCALKAALLGPLESGPLDRFGMNGTVGEIIETGYFAAAAQGDERNGFLHPRLKAHRRAGRHVRAHTERLCPVKLQGLVGFKEMKMTGYLNGAIPGIDDIEGQGLAAGVQVDLFIRRDNSAGPSIGRFGQGRGAGANRIIHGNELGPIREHPINHNPGHQLGNIGQHIVGRQQR